MTIISAGLPRPAAAYVAPPWADLTATGVSMTTKARAADYVNDHDPQDGMISPVFADFSGFPPLLIQVGGNEVLLDDPPARNSSYRQRGVAVTLQVTPTRA